MHGRTTAGTKGGDAPPLRWHTIALLGVALGLLTLAVDHVALSNQDVDPAPDRVVQLTPQPVSPSPGAIAGRVPESAR